MRNFTRRDALLLSGGAVSAVLFSALGLDAFTASAADSFGRVRFTDVDGTGSVSLTDAQKARYKALFGNPAKHGYGPYAAQGVTTIGGGRTFWLPGVDGVKSDGQIYCTEPATGAPNRGTYDAIKLTRGASIVGHKMVADNYDEIIAVLYFGYGGPGFDASMWPLADRENDQWFRNDTSGVKAAARTYWWTHLVLSAACWLPYGTAPSHGDRNGRLWVNAADTFWATLTSWVKTHILGSGANSMRTKIRARMDEVPDDFKDSCFVLYDEHSSNAGGGLGQIMVGWRQNRKGSLTVKKVTKGVPSNDTFNFRVTFSGKGAPDTVEFSLKNGQSKEISAIPYGVKYKVVELNSSGYKVDWTNQTGTISDSNSKAVCTCTNSAGSLTIKKIVAGSSTDLKFTFKVTFAGAGAPADVTFTLGHGEFKTIVPIPFGVSYTVTEVDTKGYGVTWSGARTGTINASNVELSCMATNSAGYLQLEKDVTE